MTTDKVTGASEKPYWFEIADADHSTSRPRKAKRNFPFVAVVTAGVAILGGSLLLNTPEESTANAAISSISTQATTASHVTVTPVQSAQSAPAIAPVASSTRIQSDDEGEENDD
jgi:hypothetical protein